MISRHTLILPSPLPKPSMCFGKRSAQIQAYRMKINDEITAVRTL